MTDQWADIFRFVYGALAVVVSTGFVASLVIRWDLLYRGEKLLRTGVVLEQLVISYAAYVALKEDYPPSAVGVMLTCSMGVMLVGFLVWATDSLVEDNRSIRRFHPTKKR